MKSHKDLEVNSACVFFKFHDGYYDVSLFWHLSEDYPDAASVEIENILHGLAGILRNHYEDVIETGKAIRTGIEIARKASFHSQTDTQDAQDLPDVSSFNVDPKVRH